MEESAILSGFDLLVKSGRVLYDDKQEIIEHVDGDLKFQFVVTSALSKKPALETSQQPIAATERRDGSDINTAGFELGYTNNTHILVANKFSYARPHLMLLTSDGHRRQYEPLDNSDFGTAWNLLTGLDRDYTAFFNCSKDGGCSRLHKHMQLIPTPEDSFAAFLDSAGDKEPNVPFRWFHRRLGSQTVTPAALTEVYNDLLGQATSVGEGLSEHADSAPPGAACPHNMILTKRWMIVIPRRRAGINKAGANAFGMLGYIAVATQDEVDNWVRLGLTKSLRELGVSKEMD